MTVDETVEKMKKDGILEDVAALISACQANKFDLDQTLEVLGQHFPSIFSTITPRKFQMYLNKCYILAEAYYSTRNLMRDKSLFMAYTSAKKSKAVKELILVYDRLAGTGGEVDLDDVVDVEKISDKTKETLERLFYEGQRFVNSRTKEENDGTEE